MGHAVSKSSRGAESFYDISSEVNTEQRAAPSGSDHSHILLTPESLKKQLESAKSWPGVYGTVLGSEFSAAAQQLFTLATNIMTELSNGGKYYQAEEIADSVVGLVKSWGPHVSECLKIRSYVREVIPVQMADASYEVYAGEYFSPVPFYEDNHLLKLFYFHVKDTCYKRRVISYYLECSSVVQALFVLGFVVTDRHVQVVSYDRTKPSYWVVRQDVLNDCQTRINSLAISHQGNNE
ncbi:predicted protein [Nematostella vectensis]|uniref:Uncharacterized protein n=1 Tax=Nematostella vectensis TaxID=45351 RepID=A7SW16_NEMVE|nr:uncharacterized protein LOC5503092 [Nematostella vectensis]EDO32101.1 predicted protein [Nematostella vectensis]|eukprot:XP_001624201.1 predicted protein [Nematostella vectensis]